MLLDNQLVALRCRAKLRGNLQMPSNAEEFSLAREVSGCAAARRGSRDRYSKSLSLKLKVQSHFFQSLSNSMHVSFVPVQSLKLCSPP